MLASGNILCSLGLKAWLRANQSACTNSQKYYGFVLGNVSGFWHPPSLLVHVYEEGKRSNIWVPCLLWHWAIVVDYDICKARFPPPSSRTETLLGLDHRNTFFCWLRITLRYLVDISAWSLQIILQWARTILWQRTSTLWCSTDSQAVKKNIGRFFSSIYEDNLNLWNLKLSHQADKLKALTYLIWTLRGMWPHFESQGSETEYIGLIRFAFCKRSLWLF